MIKNNVICVTALGLLLMTAAPCLQGQSSGQSRATDGKTFAPVNLRGYGTVSGSFHTETDGSVLTITCQDEDKAKLVQAKYLSDLGLQPGVSQVMTPVATIYVIDGQGAVAAFRSGAKVMILTGRSDQSLRALIGRLKPAGSSTTLTEVPMYLDRWDKFGFRHYYAVWRRPQGMTDETYNYTSEFDWAKQEDRAGFLLADPPMTTDSAEGMMNYGWWDWVEYEALKRKLPVDLHLGGGDNTWLLNAYREQTQMKMPGFTGNFHEMESPYLGGQGLLSWSSTTGEDAKLGLLQQSIRTWNKAPNLVSFLEPHGELHHGTQDIFLEYGPVADAGYRDYLKGKYGTPEAVGKRWGVPLRSWDDIHLQEIASFAGWGPSAIDVGGIWKVGYEKLDDPAPGGYGYNSRKALKAEPAPDEWFQPDFNDSSWPDFAGGGNDQEMFLEKRPAVFRRSFEVPAGWTAKHPRVWLYVWDMNQVDHWDSRVVLNGKALTSTAKASIPHWSALEVTGVVKDGKNSLALGLPQGFIAYKTYLSPVEPKQYPGLGQALNSQWVDFTDFTQWSRIEDVRRGMEMIRQVAPNQGITLMHPDEYSDGVKSLAEAYGGEFHNTGYMGIFYADYNSSLMRGADLPYSIEPDAPAKDLADFKKKFGLWEAEGVQAVDYFIHLGDIYWRPDIKADYEAHRKQITLMGQKHFLKAQMACLYSDRNAQLTGYPWGASPNTLFNGGYWAWNGCSLLAQRYPYDGLSQSSFASGDADPYEVILDSNTSIMDESMVSEIERWVRNGGTFVTLAQTGRHTPEKLDAWPISRLTGYKVVKIDKLKPDGNVDETGVLEAAGGQTVFGDSLNGLTANGLHLEKAADDVHDLLLWKDGTVAAGMRPLGKGYIVELGAKFTGTKIADRVEPGEVRPETRELREMLTAILRWRKISPEPAHLAAENSNVFLRHSVTNNGLYDAWMLWNESPTQEQTVSVVLGDSSTTFAIDVDAGTKMSVANGTLADIHLKASDTRVFLTPIGKVAEAPKAWFELQRDWWRGTTPPRPKTLPGASHRYSMDLSQSWKFKMLGSGASASSLVGEKVDDKDWPTRELSVWDVKDEGGTGHAVFRKTFTVPAQWNDGLVSVWITAWDGTTFVGSGRVLLDGKEVKPMNSASYVSIANLLLKAGSEHTLSVEMENSGVLAGMRGECWLSYEPAAPAKIDLAGKWTPSADGLTYTSPIELPGNFKTQFMKRTFSVDAKYRGTNAVLIVDGDPALVSVLINGKLVRHHHHMIGSRWSLNLTPFVRFGEENEIQLVRWNGAGAGTVRQVFMGFYPAEGYPRTGG